MSLGARWIAISVGLLVANVLVMIFLVLASNWSRPTVVPQYYERAVAWDQQMADDELAKELGWKLDLALSTEGVQVRALDGAGQPLGGAQITLRGFHRKTPTHRADATLVTDDHGQAQAVPAGWLATPGFYELDLAVKRGAVSYSVHRAVQLPAKVADAGPARR